MTTPTPYLSWFSFLYVCGIALLISCSDHTGPDQSTMEITRISPDSGAVGTRVTVYSNSIDPEHAKNQVEINGTPVPIISYNSNKLVVEVPEGVSSGQVTLEVNSKVANGPYFKVLTEGPVIEQVTPGRGGPGTPVTITGDHFLPPSAMAKVSGDSTVAPAAGDSLQAEAAEVTLKAKGEPAPNINGLPVSVAFGDRLAPLLSLSNTEIIAEVPEGATSGVITLTVDGQTATSEAFRLILPPVISEVTPTAGPVGTTVTITGGYFSPHPDSNQVTFNGIGAAITEADTARLVATVPEGATTGAVEITAGEQTATGPIFTITEAPVPQVTISDITPKQGPVGTTVTITGENFSSTQSENTVTFNGTEATVSSASTTELVTTVPQEATSGSVKVSVAGQTATGPNFNITVNEAPTITGEASFSVEENTTAVGTFTATDPDVDDLTFSLAGGDDQSWFNIDAPSGDLTFKSNPAPDYENPLDTDADNTYEVSVQVSDGDQSATQPVSVRVLDVAEAPVFSRGTITTNNEDYYADAPDFTFSAVPHGTRLIRGGGVVHFDVSMSGSVDPITSASIGGADEGAFSVEPIDPLGGHGINLSGPTLEYTHSSGGQDHQYQFTLTAQNAAGQTTTQGFTIPVQNPFAGGSGTAGDPYQVATLEQLQLVGQLLDAHYEQTADIDASATAGWNGGAGFDPIGELDNGFTGSYDGGGHTISGLTIDRPGSFQVGLFERVGPGGAIKAVSLTGAAITGDNTTGGLVGWNEGGNITHSYATGTVTGGGFGSTGGLVGSNGGTITDSYATGAVTVTGGEFGSTGGLVGSNSGSVTHSYATGAVTGNIDTGGLVGSNSGSVTESYWDRETTGQATSAGGTGLSTAEMQGDAAQTHMAGFDFTNVWQVQTSPGDYPTLQNNPEE